MISGGSGLWPSVPLSIVLFFPMLEYSKCFIRFKRIVLSFVFLFSNVSILSFLLSLLSVKSHSRKDFFGNVVHLKQKQRWNNVYEDKNKPGRDVYS